MVTSWCDLRSDEVCLCVCVYVFFSSGSIDRVVR